MKKEIINFNEVKLLKILSFLKSFLHGILIHFKKTKTVYAFLK